MENEKWNIKVGNVKEKRRWKRETGVRILTPVQDLKRR